MGRSSRLAIGAVIAAVAAGQVAPSHLAAGVALVLAAILLLGETLPGRSVRSLLPIALGAGLIVIRLALMPAAPAAPEAPQAGAGPWHLTVEAVGSARNGQQAATLASGPDDGPILRVAATLPRYPAVIPGDRVVVEGTIRGRPDSPYGEYLLRIGAIGTLASRTLSVEPAPDDPGRRLEGLRRGAGDALAAVLPEPEAGLAAGILIGLRDRVDRDLASAFTTAGVSHVVAISGWNIAIVAVAIASVTGRLGRRRRSVVTILAIVAYVAFAGASASVVRAALMAATVLLARETGRAGRAAAALGWAATLLLVSDPHLIGDAGFQLSSLATAGLIAWATPLTAWLEAIGRGRLPHWLAESLGVSLAAQAATLPIIFVSFGRLALLSPLVNLVVVPLVAPAMAVGLVAMAGGIAVLAGLPPIVGAILATPGWVILRILVTVVQTAASLPFGSVTLAPPLDVAAAACAALGLLAVSWWPRRPRSLGRSAGAVVRTRPTSPAQENQPRRTHVDAGLRLRRAGIASLVLAVAVTGAVFAARPAGFARVSILDVGQGDAILVEGSRGGRLLIDGGPDPDRLLVALDQRIPPWDRRFDAVILSHPHEDHVAGLALLLERYHVDRVFEPGMRGPGPGYAAWLRDLASSPALVRLGLAAGDRLTVDEIELRVLWPIRGQVPSLPPDGGTGINNVSVVLLGQVGARRFLLMGDVEEAIDPSLLADGLPRVDLLKIAHHGSRTATTQAFVDTVRPAVAVASAGAGNPYGHPAKATLDRLAASGARVLRTDLDGTVVVGFEDGGMAVRAEGGRSAAAASPTRTNEATTVVTKTASAVAGVGTAGFLCAVPATAIIPERVPAPRPASPSPTRRHPAPVVDPDDTPGRRVLPPALPPSQNGRGVARIRRPSDRWRSVPDPGRRLRRGSRRAAGGRGTAAHEDGSDRAVREGHRHHRAAAPDRDLAAIRATDIRDIDRRRADRRVTRGELVEPARAGGRVHRTAVAA